MRFISTMLPRVELLLAPWNSPGALIGVGGGIAGGATGGGSGGSVGGSSSAAQSVLALHDTSKPLGRVIQLGQPAQDALTDAGRNTAVNSARAGASFGVRKTSPRGMGSNNTPIAFFGGGALEGRGGPSSGQ